MFAELISWQKYTDVDHIISNRTAVAGSGALVQLFEAPIMSNKTKHFLPVNTSKMDFLQDFQRLGKSTFQHHQLERIQKENYNHMASSLPFGMLMLQMDYAENIKLVLLDQRCFLLNTYRI
jgi:hypothetical protein